MIGSVALYGHFGGDRTGFTICGGEVYTALDCLRQIYQRWEVDRDRHRNSGRCRKKCSGSLQ